MQDQITKFLPLLCFPLVTKDIISLIVDQLINLRYFKFGYVNLPHKYHSTICEKLPPLPKEGCTGRPFWNSKESFGLFYKKDEHCFLYKNKKDYYKLEIDQKGYFCLGCSPGSGPQPFIITYIDNINKEIGYILPYVSIMGATNIPIGEETVNLIVGKDMEGCDPYETKHDNNLKFRGANEKYKVTYRKADFLDQSWLSVDVGSFGNYGLPLHRDPVTYEFID